MGSEDSPKLMNKCGLLEKDGSIRKRGAVLVPAIFTQGIRIPAFLTLSEPTKITEPAKIDVRIAEVGEIEKHFAGHRRPETILSASTMSDLPPYRPAGVGRYSGK